MKSQKNSAIQKHVILFQKKPNRWSCLSTSFANVIGVEHADFIKKVGHDGGKKINKLEDPMCRIGFLPDEMVEACLKFGFAVITLHTFPVLETAEKKHIDLFTTKKALIRFKNYLNSSRGVLTGRKPGSKYDHALFFNRGTIYDPDTGLEVKNIEDFEITVFYKVVKIYEEN